MAARVGRRRRSGASGVGGSAGGMGVVKQLTNHMILSDPDEETESEVARAGELMALPPSNRGVFDYANNTYRPPVINPVLPRQQLARHGTASSIKWEAPPHDYHLQYPKLVSSLTGKKKALLIGILYKGTHNELEGCVNDTINMRRFLIDKYGFKQENIRIMREDSKNRFLIPTRSNILANMRWLISGALPGDSLVFQFSGHGSQVADLDGDEDDGLDETICPVDFEKNGMIVDDEMNRILVRDLPSGVRLTAVFAFTYMPNGRIKRTDKFQTIGRMARGTARGIIRGSFRDILSSIWNGIKNLQLPTISLSQRVENRGSVHADVILFAGCKDSQTSSDAKVDGKSTGAMSYTLIKILRERSDITYAQLMTEIRHMLADNFSQTPQISSARYMDMTQPFHI
eukprot:jgi/Hompol1/6395/HPOL_000851-RA